MTKLAAEMHAGTTLLRTLTVYVVPAVKPLKVFELCHIVPSLLYSKLVPKGDVITIVPVVTVQVGWVIVACGTAGAVGLARMVTQVGRDVQAEALVTVTLYTPGFKPAK